MSPVFPVWFDELHIGDVIVANDGALGFAYTDAWLATRGAFPLSLTLPLEDAAYPSEVISSRACGREHDRDVNAARNIRSQGILKLKAEGLSVSACGSFPVRRADRPLQPEAGSPVLWGGEQSL